jgi:hypothetical protein
VAPGFSANVNGRLAVSKSSAWTLTGGTDTITTLYEMYSYDSAGRVVKKRLRVSNSSIGYVDQEVENGSTGAKLNSLKCPDIDVPFTYYYDNMLRPNQMTWQGPNYADGIVDLVNKVSSDH